MLKTELEVVTIGEPNIAALQESERRLFFETLYARVLELAKEKKEKVVTQKLVQKWLFLLKKCLNFLLANHLKNHFNYLMDIISMIKSCLLYHFTFYV